MKLTPYLMFSGTCREAFAFYEQCLGGKVLFMTTYSQAPPPHEAMREMGDRIMHATLGFEGNILMGSDCPPDQQLTPPSTQLAIEAESVEKAEALFASLSDGATVTMPLGETFWAYRFGMLTDRFGVPWMVSAGKPSEHSKS